MARNWKQVILTTAGFNSQSGLLNAIRSPATLVTSPKNTWDGPVSMAPPPQFNDLDTFVGKVQIPAEGGGRIHLKHMEPFDLDITVEGTASTKNSSATLSLDDWDDLNNCIGYPTKLKHAFDLDLSASATARGEKDFDVFDVLVGYATVGVYAEGQVLSYSGHMSPTGTFNMKNGDYDLKNKRYIDNMKGPKKIEVGGNLSWCWRRLIRSDKCHGKDIAFFSI